MSRIALGRDGPTSMTHRLAAVSASAALQKAASASNLISSGSLHIDSLLAGGLARGKVVEVHGPPGSGKTALGITAASNALSRGDSVVWVDCCTVVTPSRLLEIATCRASEIDSPLTVDSAKILDRFHHFTAPHLTHLLTLILHPPPSFPPPSTTLLVIDSISTLFSLAFPTPADFARSGPSSTTESASSRRFVLQRDLVSALNKLAAVRDVAILVTSGLATRMERDIVSPTASRQRAVLRPALMAKAWSEGLWARVLLLRHWGPRTSKRGGAKASKENKTITRFAGLVKLGNVEYEAFGRTVMFDIEQAGIVDVSIASHVATKTTFSQRARVVPPSAAALAPQDTGATTTLVPSKRGANEIADSEDEFSNTGELNGLETGSGSDLEELDELGLTREEQALMELAMEEALNGEHEAE